MACLHFLQQVCTGSFEERVLNESCVDDVDQCEDWARKGECDRNPGYMRSICRKSCYVCEQYVKVPSCLEFLRSIYTMCAKPSTTQ